MVITGLTRNQFVRKHTRVRIPLSPPTKNALLSTDKGAFFELSVPLVRNVKYASRVERTSLGANIREAQYAHGKADFIAKLQIALKKANKTGCIKCKFKAFDTARFHLSLLIRLFFVI